MGPLGSISKLSLKWKFIGFTLFILLAVESMFSCYNLNYIRDLIKKDDITRVQLITEIIKNGLYSLMLQGRGAEFQNFLDSLIAEELEEVRIFDPYSGTIVASSVRSEIGQKIYREDIERYRSQAKPQVFVHKKDGQMVYSMLIPIRNDRACQRCHNDDRPVRGVIDVEVSMKRTHERLQTLKQRTVLFAILSSLTMGLGLFVLLSVLITKDLSRFMEVMRRIKKGDLSVRFAPRRKDEFRVLAETFNSMLNEIEQTRAELQRVHLEELKRMERMATLGELAAAVAHEIKNPLAGISGAIQVLREDMSEEDPRREIITEVLQEVERLDRTIRDLLRFARPQEPQKMDTELKELLTRTLGLIKLKAEKQNVVIETDIKKEVTINVDPQQLQQVLLNLILNALQAMPSGGKLTISADVEDGYCSITVQDTGEGILPEDLPNLFRPFYTTRGRGTGLGLSISKNIVEAHGGSIDVESRPGKGTKFIVRLPI